MKNFYNLIFISIFCNLTAEINNNPSYNLSYDLHMSPYAGGEDLLYVHRCIEKIEEQLFDVLNIKLSKNTVSREFRAFEEILGWLPLNYYMMVIQHEVFGHGYRIREINRNKVYKPTYQIGVPIPYGNGGGRTNFYITDKCTTTELSAISIAGMEATSILANETKFKWLESGKINPKETSLYFFSLHDATIYMGTCRQYIDNYSGHDINDYIYLVNSTYTDGYLKKKTIQNIALFNLLDPFTYYSVFSTLNYIVTGNSFKIPMIPVYSWGYLPSLRVSLSPFGPEWNLENYLAKNGVYHYFNLNFGYHAKNIYSRIGFYSPKLWKMKKVLIGLRSDLYYQPKLLLKPGSTAAFDLDFDNLLTTPLYTEKQQHKKNIGIYASCIITYKTQPGFMMEIGGKTKGFVPGNALRAAPIFRISYSMKF